MNKPKYTIGTVTQIGQCREVVIAYDARGTKWFVERPYKTIDQKGATCSRSESEITAGLLREIDVRVGTEFEEGGKTWRAVGRAKCSRGPITPTNGELIDARICLPRWTSLDVMRPQVIATAQIIAAILAQRDQDADTRAWRPQEGERVKNRHGSAAGTITTVAHDTCRVRWDTGYAGYHRTIDLMPMPQSSPDTCHSCGEPLDGGHVKLCHACNNARGSTPEPSAPAPEKPRKPCYVTVYGTRYQIGGMTIADDNLIILSYDAGGKSGLAGVRLHPDGSWSGKDARGVVTVTPKHMRRACKRYGVLYPGPKKAKRAKTQEEK